MPEPATGAISLIERYGAMGLLAVLVLVFCATMWKLVPQIVAMFRELTENNRKQRAESVAALSTLSDKFSAALEKQGNKFEDILDKQSKSAEADRRRTEEVFLRQLHEERQANITAYKELAMAVRENTKATSEFTSYMKGVYGTKPNPRDHRRDSSGGN